MTNRQFNRYKRFKTKKNKSEFTRLNTTRPICDVLFTCSISLTNCEERTQTHAEYMRYHRIQRLKREQFWYTATTNRGQRLYPYTSA